MLADSGPISGEVNFDLLHSTHGYPPSMDGGISMDSRNPHGIIAYISSLNSTSNGACHPGTAMLSINNDAIIDRRHYLLPLPITTTITKHLAASTSLSAPRYKHLATSTSLPQREQSNRVAK